jgi:hypothetical protein
VGNRRVTGENREKELKTAHEEEAKYLAKEDRLIDYVDKKARVIYKYRCKPQRMSNG